MPNQIENSSQTQTDKQRAMQCDGLNMISGTRSIAISISISTLPSHTTHFPTQARTRTRLGSLKDGATSGVNDGSAKMSLYELLGIPEMVTLPEIKQAYKQLARKYHPDVSPPEKVPEYTEWSVRVQEASETLSDPRKRAIYDRDLARGIHLVFSTRRMMDEFDEEVEDKSEWRNRWQGQPSELKKRIMYKDASGNMSWGARMRRQREESSS